MKSLMLFSLLVFCFGLEARALPVSCEGSAKSAVEAELMKRGAQPGSFLVEEPVVSQMDSEKGWVVYRVRVMVAQATTYQVFEVRVKAATCAPTSVELVDGLNYIV